MDGTAGSSCSVTDNNDGTKTITCEDGTSATVSDGQDGRDGRDFVVSEPGLAVTFTSTAGTVADRRVSVDLRLEDGSGTALDRLGEFTQGPVSVSFLLAVIAPDSRFEDGRYQNLITRTVSSTISGESAEQPGNETDGDWTELGEGLYRYTFNALLPENFDSAQTVSVSFYSTRDFEGVRYVSNGTLNFRPDAGTPAKRDLYSNDACNACHTGLSAHGSTGRRDVKVCSTCHAPGYADPDTGNSIDMGVMIHKIHRGRDLPTVNDPINEPYFILGFRNSIHDYSDVGFPHSVNNCASCHAGGDANQVDRWNLNPTQRVCGSCHDNVVFSGFDPNNPQLPAGYIPHGNPPTEQPDDTNCTVCHGATTGVAPIIAAHLTDLANPAVVKLELALDDVADTTPTDNPTVTFTVTENGTPKDVSGDATFEGRVIIAGSTPDYAGEFSENFDGTTVVGVDAVNGVFRYTMTASIAGVAFDMGIPATGTFGFTLRGRTPESRAKNPNTIFKAVTDMSPVPRRTVVTLQQCDNCHAGELAEHGRNYTNTETCVMCHNAADNPGYNFGYLVHRVHINNEDLHYPGDSRVCSSCHEGNSYTLPLPSGLLPMVTIPYNGGTVTTGPTTQACLGCHLSDSTVAHGATNTAPDGREACGTCHGSGSELSVENAHARPDWD